jgi:LytS/YehU family sensor histidine kinase
MVFRHIESMKNVTALELSIAKQEMDLLKSQIHPQFFLNTLNSLYLMTKDNKKASEVVSKLSDLLSFTLYNSNKSLIPLKDELSYSRTLRKISELRVINANQELDLLKSQIHPHFLFNTLNNLYRLVMENEKAGEVVLSLSELLRFTLYEYNKDFIPLKKEIKFLEYYIELEKINRYRHVDIDYDFKEIENEEIQIAPLMFFNFVENAVKHGMNKSKEKSRIEFRLKQSNHTVFFGIRNSKPNKLKVPALHGQDLNNMRKRLDMLFRDKYALEIQEDNFCIEIILSLYREEKYSKKL